MIYCIGSRCRPKIVRSLLRKEEAIFLPRLMRMSQTLLGKQRRPCFTNLFENMSQHACVFASYGQLCTRAHLDEMFTRARNYSTC